uniref:CSON011068 protein n=1 Tax=Culicoides sonorensis TaxID=179676 RepID=A0A336K197_CULSO
MAQVILRLCYFYTIVILVLKDSVVNADNISKDMNMLYENSILLELFKQLSWNSTVASDECIGALKIFEKALRLEASASLPSDILYGNNFWLGSKQECELISNPVSITLTKQYYKRLSQKLMETPGDLKMVYKVVRGNVFSSIQSNMKYFHKEEILHLGLCLPDSCNKIDVKNLMSNFFSNNQSKIRTLFDLNVKDLNVSDLKLNSSFYTKKTFFLLCIVIVSTLLISIAACFNETGLTKDTKLSIIFKSFCVTSNFRSIYSTKSATFPEINGLRLISNLFILGFHVQYFSFFKISSKHYAFLLAEKLAMTMITNGPIFVEVFFIISGFLLSYSYVKNDTQINLLFRSPIHECFKFIWISLVKRLFRIIPLYFFVILLTEVTATYFADTSIFELYEKYDYNCQHYWWRNALFIQNFYPFNELCLNWSWTLACDLQFFIVTTLVYVIYCKNKLCGKLFFGGILLFFFGTSTFVLIKYQFLPTFDIYYTTLDELYISPFSRSPAYIVGVAMGYVIAKKQNKIEKSCWNLIWYCVYFVSIFTFLIPMYRTAPLWLAITILSLGKWIFPACASWWFLSPSFGYKNIVTNFLSHPIFQHFGRISYAFYLLNPYLIIYSLALSDFPLQLDPVLITIYTFGIILLNYIVSIIFTIFFEIPYLNLVHILTLSNK